MGAADAGGRTQAAGEEPNPMVGAPPIAILHPAVTGHGQ
jgi:hypothetical protein